LSSLTIPKNVVQIDLSAFSGCTKMTTYRPNPPYLATLYTDAVPGDYVYDFFLPPGTNGFYINLAEPICFNKGTKILCLCSETMEDKYVPVEDLKAGDVVKTYLHGYRSITAIGTGKLLNNPSKHSSCMYCLKKENYDGLFEDLVVTGGHSILVDDLGDLKDVNATYFPEGNLKIDDKFLLLSAVSPLFSKITKNEIYDYYHFVLSNDGDDNKRYGVWANGILTETPSMNQFLAGQVEPVP
jgi:hypothetical protein